MLNRTAQVFRSRVRRLVVLGATALTCSAVMAAPSAMADTTPPVKQQTQQTQQVYLVVVMQTVYVS